MTRIPRFSATLARVIRQRTAAAVLAPASDIGAFELPERIFAGGFDGG